MKTNYHTHTLRCGHATGSDEAYVQAAISQGFDLLGFSDHVPWPYRSGFTSPRVRMLVSQLNEYMASIRRLKEAYAGKIEILTGFECEYFPDYIDWLREMKQEKKPDYLILGNHFDGSDETGMYFGSSRTAEHLRAYTDSAIKGMETGLFDYLAHPDLFMRRYGKFDENCRAASRDICRACRAMNLPVEYNLHDRYVGVNRSSEGYPHPAFFEIAAEEGLRIILGVDAHDPKELSDPTQWNRAMREMESFGDLVIDHLPTGE